MKQLLCSRLFHNTTRRFHKPITRTEIHQLLSKPTWTIKQYFQPMSHSQFGSNKKVSDIFNKMIKLSGLNIETRELKEKTEQDLERALSIQTMFISHLYEEDGEVGQVDMKKSNKSFEGGGDKDNDTQFRLIACDHIAPKPLGLRQLLKDVENVDKRVDAEKGELGGFTLEDLKVKQM